MQTICQFMVKTGIHEKTSNDWIQSLPQLFTSSDSDDRADLLQALGGVLQKNAAIKPEQLAKQLEAYGWTQQSAVVAWLVFFSFNGL